MDGTISNKCLMVEKENKILEIKYAKGERLSQLLAQLMAQYSEERLGWPQLADKTLRQ